MRYQPKHFWKQVSYPLRLLSLLVARRLPGLDRLLTKGAQQPQQQLEPARRIGVALGGGGGKGGAHLGVLSVIEELAVPIDVITGTSIGGAVGILYAAGFTLPEITQIFHASALRRIATPDPTHTGFIGARKREALLNRLLGDCTFADLRIPCAVTATDLVSGRLVILDQGPLVPAIMATTAIPGVFPPICRGEEMLADGGVLNNLPVDIAEQMGAQRVIAIQLVSGGDGWELPKPAPGNPFARFTLAPHQFAVANRALALMIAQSTELLLRRHPPAILMRPDVEHIATLDMTQPEEGYRAGQQAAYAVQAELLGLRDWRLAQDPRSTATLVPALRPF